MICNNDIFTHTLCSHNVHIETKAHYQAVATKRPNKSFQPFDLCFYVKKSAFFYIFLVLGLFIILLYLIYH